MVTINVPFFLSLFFLFFYIIFADDFSPAVRSVSPSPKSLRKGIKDPNSCDEPATIASFEPVMVVNTKDLSIGLRLEKFFEDSFCKWGIFVASNPYWIMFISLLVSVILSLGVCYWKVTTDPVDLWVSSGSKARQDLNYFNENFWKFYRIQQIVIAPATSGGKSGHFNYTYVRNRKNVTTEFGPAFNQTFLLDIFNLQRSIESLVYKAPNGAKVSLDDICFKPLGKECATQSIFTYFLNNESYILDANYGERIEVCTR